MVNHNPENQFQKGNKHAKGGGRKPGPSVFQKLLNEALIEAVTQLGEIRVVKEFNGDGNEVGRHYEWDGKDGLVGFLRFAAVHHTPSVIGLLGRILPFQLNVKSERKVEVTYPTLEEAREALRQRGFDPAVIEAARIPKFIEHKE
jgi:hypothetical protein